MWVLPGDLLFSKERTMYYILKVLLRLKFGLVSRVVGHSAMVFIPGVLSPTATDLIKVWYRSK